jgi:hypothetical protein
MMEDGEAVPFRKLAASPCTAEVVLFETQSVKKP